MLLYKYRTIRKFINDPRVFHLCGKTGNSTSYSAPGKIHRFKKSYKTKYLILFIFLVATLSTSMPLQVGSLIVQRYSETHLRPC